MSKYGTNGAPYKWPLTLTRTALSRKEIRLKTGFSLAVFSAKPTGEFPRVRGAGDVSTSVRKEGLLRRRIDSFRLD